jgi:hypothetical protein
VNPKEKLQAILAEINDRIGEIKSSIVQNAELGEDDYHDDDDLHLTEDDQEIGDESNPVLDDLEIAYLSDEGRAEYDFLVNIRAIALGEV